MLPGFIKILYTKSIYLLVSLSGKKCPCQYLKENFYFRRIYHDILELVEQSMDVNLIDARVRYRFTDTPILDGITIHEINGQVIILIPTVCSVHCLTFSHPERIHKQVCE